MTQRPQTIPHTKRQTCQNTSGEALERAYLYLSPSTWTALKALCAVSDTPSSQLIEQLILAACGTHKKDINDLFNPRPRNT